MSSPKTQGLGRSRFKEATARSFADRKARADFKAFDKLMRRRSGVAPRKGDEIPAS